MSNDTTGGFAGDPTAAFTPPASSGCCGTTPTAGTTATVESTCCGTTEAATATGTCCAPAAKAEAITDGAGCCG